jgi:hypothetical protein
MIESVFSITLKIKICLKLTLLFTFEREFQIYLFVMFQLTLCILKPDVVRSPLLFNVRVT